MPIIIIGVFIVGAVVGVFLGIGLLSFWDFAGIAEDRADELLNSTENPKLMQLAEEEDSMEKMLELFSAHGIEVLELEQENAELKQQIAELTNTKNTIQSIFKTQDNQ